MCRLESHHRSTACRGSVLNRRGSVAFLSQVFNGGLELLGSFSHGETTDIRKQTLPRPHVWFCLTSIMRVRVWFSVWEGLSSRWSVAVWSRYYKSTKRVKWSFWVNKKHFPFEFCCQHHLLNTLRRSRDVGILTQDQSRWSLPWWKPNGGWSRSLAEGTQDQLPPLFISSSWGFWRVYLQSPLPPPCSAAPGCWTTCTLIGSGVTHTLYIRKTVCSCYTFWFTVNLIAAVCLLLPALKTPVQWM